MSPTKKGRYIINLKKSTRERIGLLVGLFIIFALFGLAGNIPEKKGCWTTEEVRK
jgi:hypothetical protein